MVGGDIVLIFFSLYLALFLKWQKLISLRIFFHFVKQFFWLFLFWIFLFFVFDFYSIEKKDYKNFSFFRYFLIFLFLALFSGIFYFYFLPNTSIAPRTILILEIFIFSILLLSWHTFWDFVFKKYIEREKIIFWGNFPERNFLIDFIKKKRIFYNVVGVFEKDLNIAKIKEKIREKNINRIIISPEIKNFNELFFSFPQLEIESFASFYERVTERFPLSSLDDPNVLTEFLKEEDRIYSFLKRLFDIFIGFIGFLVFIITLPLIAFFIKSTSRGPVFFIQERFGRGRKIFRSFKYRSMYHIEKQRRDDIWREKNKKEITLVGRFLRFTHLDELPQFINILKGDLSMIGPRPEWERIAKIYEKEIPFYYLRYKVKPGFTGWAQINYPPSTSVKEAKEKFEYDLYYIKNRSFLFDIAIFLKSLRKIFG